MASLFSASIVDEASVCKLVELSDEVTISLLMWPTSFMSSYILVISNFGSELSLWQKEPETLILLEVNFTLDFCDSDFRNLGIGCTGDVNLEFSLDSLAVLVLD